MNVYPDGEALSDWERQILEDMELEFGLSDQRLLPFYGPDAAPLSLIEAHLVATEAAVAFAALTFSFAGALAGLATIGTSLWVASVRAAQGLRSRPGQAVRARV
jgi:hypothetical protein